MKYEEELNKKGEITIMNETFYYDNLVYEVLITKETNNKENYYNIYVNNEQFKEEPLNNLQLQEPSNLNIVFDKKYCELRALEFYLWFKYSINDKVLSFNIKEVK